MERQIDRKRGSIFHASLIKEVVDQMKKGQFNNTQRSVLYIDMESKNNDFLFTNFAFFFNSFFSVEPKAMIDRIDFLNFPSLSLYCRSFSSSKKTNNSGLRLNLALIMFRYIKKGEKMKLIFRNNENVVESLFFSFRLSKLPKEFRPRRSAYLSIPSLLNI